MRQAKAWFIPFGDPGLFDAFVESLDVAAIGPPLMRVGALDRQRRIAFTRPGIQLVDPAQPGSSQLSLSLPLEDHAAFITTDCIEAPKL